ncbi:MAG: hypothetical protein ACLBM4_07275, partial [Dolichospermum sp.]
MAIIRRIYDSVSILMESNLPLLAVDFTDDITDNLITYKLQPSGKNSYHLDEKKYEELSNLKIEIVHIWAIIKSQGGLLIDKRCYPDNFN